MKQVLMVDNFDSFTFNLVDYFKQTKAEVLVYRNTINLSVIKKLQPDLLVLSPGPGNPSQAGNLLTIIREFSSQLPMFGVCLGMQAMIEAFGGSLRILNKPMHGKSSLVEHDGKSVFQGIKNPVEVGRYHSLAAKQVPDVFEITATTQDHNNNEVVMGIRHKSLPIEGVQFHPESVLTFKQDAGLQMIKNLMKQL